MSVSASHPSDRPVRRLSARSSRCSACGYGVSVSPPPAECPMCRATAWEPGGWSPFTLQLERRAERDEFPPDAA